MGQSGTSFMKAETSRYSLQPMGITISGVFPRLCILCQLGPLRCPEYPAHSHWSLTPSGTVYVDWAHHGQYELSVDPELKVLGTIQFAFRI